MAAADATATHNQHAVSNYSANHHGGCLLKILLGTKVCVSSNETYM